MLYDEEREEDFDDDYWKRDTDSSVVGGSGDNEEELEPSIVHLDTGSERDGEVHCDTDEREKEVEGL